MSNAWQIAEGRGTDNPGTVHMRVDGYGLNTGI